MAGKADPPEYPQLLIAWEESGDLHAYTTVYGEWDYDDAIEDCRAKHGHAKLLMAVDHGLPLD